MNRRQFTTGLAALAAAPAVPAKALASLPAAGAAIPHPARFWAIYMSHLHGTCSPQTLSKVTGIDPSIAQGYLSRLVSEGVLTPTRMAAKVVSTQTKAVKQPSRLRERLNKFLERPAETTEIAQSGDSPSVNHDLTQLSDDPDPITTDPSAEDTN